MHKRPLFAHEKEVRGLLRLNGAGGIGRNIGPDGTIHAMPFVEAESPKYFRIPIDVNALVASIVLSPTSPVSWLSQIRGIVGVSDYEISVSWSDLHDAD